MTLSLVRSFGILLALAISPTLIACGSDDGGGEKNAGGTSTGGSSAGTSSTTAGTNSNAGSTSQPACGISNCETGQHCNNGICVNGCLTDANCATNQTCAEIDADSKIGTCKNKTTAPAKDCDAFCQKSLACMDPDFTQCMQVCEGSSAACIACVNDSNCGAGCEAVCER